jgi:hypothetical protein
VVGRPWRRYLLAGPSTGDLSAKRYPSGPKGLRVPTGQEKNKEELSHHRKLPTASAPPCLGTNTDGARCCVLASRSPPR